MYTIRLYYRRGKNVWKLCFLNTEEMPDKWAEKLCKYSINREETIRKKGYQIALEQGFDISQTAEQIIELYQ